MGQAVGKGGPVTPPPPPQAVETLVGFLLPPACREEVLGDLHERCRSPRHYLFEALPVVPMVVASRIRRTTDAQVFLMQAFVLGLPFLGAAWFRDRGLLDSRWGLLRLAVPAAIALMVIVLEDAYARPGVRSPLDLLRGPVLGLGAALLWESLLPGMALPSWILLCGAAAGLLLSCTVRLSFPPLTGRPQGAGGPSFWLKRNTEPSAAPPRWIRLAKVIGLVLALALVAFYQITRRG